MMKFGLVIRTGQYNGKDWKLLNIPFIKVGFHKLRKMSNGKFLIWGSNDDNGFLEKLFVFDGVNKLTEIYSDTFYPGLYEMNGSVYVTINKKIFKCDNDKLVLWKDFSATEFYGTVLGRSEKDFFSAGYEGILHYNGTDLVYLYHTNNLDLGGELIFKDDVFFYGYDSEKKINVLIRGTIKNE